MSGVLDDRADDCVLSFLHGCLGVATEGGECGAEGLQVGDGAVNLGDPSVNESQYGGAGLAAASLQVDDLADLVEA